MKQSTGRERKSLIRLTCVDLELSLTDSLRNQFVFYKRGGRNKA